MGKKVLRVGPMGSGAAMKLTTNLVASSISVAMVEGLIFAAKAGLEPFLVAEVLAERSPLIARWAPQVLAGEFNPFFPLRLAHKDVHLALAAARNLGVPSSRWPRSGSSRQPPWRRGWAISTRQPRSRSWRTSPDFGCGSKSPDRGTPSGIHVLPWEQARQPLRIVLTPASGWSYEIVLIPPRGERITGSRRGWRQVSER
jgi:hypothetical protein